MDIVIKKIKIRLNKERRKLKNAGFRQFNKR